MERLNNILKNETIIVALATALCYTGAYAYERGFSLYFGIPTEFISVTLSSIITTISLFATFLMLLYMTSTIPILISKSKKIKNKYLIIFLYLSPIWMLFNLIFYLMNGLQKYPITFITIAYSLLCISIASNTDKSFDETKSNPEQKPQSLLTKIDSAAGFIFWFSFIFFAITSGTGTYIARTSDNFNTFIFKKEEYKLIKIYGDNIIAIKSLDTKKPKGVFVFKTEDLMGIRINQIKNKNILSEE